MITLRKNQTEPIRKAVEFFNAKNPAPSLIVLPTAWGKSILTAFTAKEIEGKLLVLQPSKELLEQNYKKYITLCGNDLQVQAGIYSASFGRKDINKITYATIGSIKNIGALFKQLGFKKMLIDEAHLYPREADSMLGKFLAESGITHVLGITATPIKLQQNTDLNGNRFSKLQMLTSRSKKGNFFKDIIHVGQVQEMVELGFWSKLEYQQTEFDASKLVYNSSRSEYTEESVQLSFMANNTRDRIFQELDNHADRQHILVFVPSVGEAKQMAVEYPNSAAIYGDMHKAEREKVIADFRSGKTRVIFNVRVLSTGFDYTGIDCIIFGISTASIALYYQIVGRGTRIDPNKKDCLIIDLSGNVERFGRVEDIVFEKDTLWRMYGTGGKLLSGLPIHELGTVKRDDVIAKRAEAAQKWAGKPIEIMPFGKHKGEFIRNIPADYKRWALENIIWHNGNMNLKQALTA
ncbi:MAG: DEAD/DEAH box helicase family protein [Prevotellaceae bacterium]|jgi:DNA repair protein RadD|nr:DEAD/DEAH box helicase family protein [Prevotellaceae bacterium]